MREDSFSNDEAGAAAYAQHAGISEDFGGGPGDQEPNPLLDATRLCNRCEHGHGGHVCAWCAGAERRAS